MFVTFKEDICASSMTLSLKKNDIFVFYKDVGDFSQVCDTLWNSENIEFLQRSAMFSVRYNHFL